MSAHAATLGMPAQSEALKPSGPWTDLALTLPIFVGYHLGVVFLPVRNAADVVTRELIDLAKHDMTMYAGLTVGIGAILTAVLLAMGRGHTLKWQKFLAIAAEGVVYAIAMRLVAGYVVGRLFLAAGYAEGISGLVMSLGAGFYEEIAFRVVLFGLGTKFILHWFPTWQPVLTKLVWAIAAAALFSAWHHIGASGEAFDMKVFAFRWVCGIVFTVIYAFRGFAPAVWTHALYDLWVLAL